VKHGEWLSLVRPRPTYTFSLFTQRNLHYLPYN
jgi:hypothetical protein